MARSKSKTATTPEAKPPGAAEPPKKRGKKPFVPTEEHRHIVETAIGHGYPEFEVSCLIRNPKTGKRIDEKTLRLHFADEIERGMASAHFEATVSLRTLIRGRPAQYDANGNLVRAEVPINPASVIFYHKTRRGWSETQNLNHSGAVEFTDAKSELQRRISRHAGKDESEEIGEGARVTH